MESVQKKIDQRIIETLGVGEEFVTDNALFADDLGVDSLDFFELLTAIEKDFGMHIPEDEAEKLKTVGALKTYVAKNAPRAYAE